MTNLAIRRRAARGVGGVVVPRVTFGDTSVGSIISFFVRVSHRCSSPSVPPRRHNMGLVLGITTTTTRRALSSKGLFRARTADGGNVTPVAFSTHCVSLCSNLRCTYRLSGLGFQVHNAAIVVVPRGRTSISVIDHACAMLPSVRRHTTSVSADSSSSSSSRRNNDFFSRSSSSSITSSNNAS